jgi:hypothetical protein
VLAGLSISAVALPVRRFHGISVAISAVAVCLAYFAFRAATAGKTDDEALIAAFRRGMIGAFVALIAIIVCILIFGPEANSSIAHAVGKPASHLTTFRLLVASVLLGFGAGFVLRMPVNT